MIEACRKERKKRIITKELYNKIVPQDVIVKKVEEIETYDELGNMSVKRITHRVNVTKLVNETAKVVLADVARKKIQELENIFKKENEK